MKHQCNTSKTIENSNILIIKLKDEINLSEPPYSQLLDILDLTNINYYKFSKDVSKRNNDEKKDFINAYKANYKRFYEIKNAITEFNATESKKKETTSTLTATQLKSFKQFINILKEDRLNIKFLFDCNYLDTINNLISNHLELRKKQPAHVKKYIPVNFYNFFKIDLNKSEKTSQITQILNKLRAFTKQSKNIQNQIFDYLYIQPLRFDTSFGVTSSTANQNYFDEMGIEYNTNGSLGDGVKIIHFERNFWNINHSQYVFDDDPNVCLNENIRDTEIFLKNEDVETITHGNKTLGVLKAKHGNKDRRGKDLCRGIIPNANYNFVSAVSSINNDKKPSDHNYEAAFLASVEEGENQKGSIILIEFGSKFEGYPFEFEPVIRELIKLAHANNIIIIESAGNGSNNIAASTDDVTVYDKIENFLVVKELWDLYIDYPYLEVRNYQDMDEYINDLILNPLAINIGSAIKHEDGYYTRYANSNWGLPYVKIFGQGAEVKTTYYDPNASRRSKYIDFGETSSAVAILAGVCGSLQGIAMANGKYITPLKMYELLQESENANIVETAIGPIGHIPNFITMKNSLLSQIDLLPNL